MRNIVAIVLLSFIIVTNDLYAQVRDLSEYVDPFIGVENGGNVFPGPCVPFGMVKLGPDCGNKDWNAGWDSNGNIHGFSHTHVSGTGGGCKYGNILMQPMVGDLDLQDYSSPRSCEAAALAAYSVNLDRYNVQVNLTALNKSGFHEYTFPASSKSKILIDLGSFLLSHEKQRFVGSEIRVLSNTEIEGYSRIRGGWNEGGAYTVYFYAKFNTPADSFATWKNNIISPNTPFQADTNQKTGAYFSYTTKEGQKIKVKVGISFLGVNKAKANLEEMNSWTYDVIRDKAKSQWNSILNKIQIETDDENKKIFYTALYHSFLQPVDRTGENPKWASTEPYYDDYFAIWDTFRATHPLFTILEPSRQRDMLKSLIDIYKHDGYMPDSRSGNDNGRVQGGSNCDILIADALVKGIKGIDYETALKAMLKNAEVSPGGDERKEGRGGIQDYNTKGYVSTNYERSGTRTFEYSNCDFAIATVASSLGKMDIAKKYYSKAKNWCNLWNDSIESLGSKGFLWPKKADGTWVSKQDYDVFKGGTWPDFLYETFSWEMSFYVPHDINMLIEKCGGKEKFIQRLDTYFTHEKWDQRWFIGLFQVSNEPGFLVPVYYNYVGRPDKTAEITRKTLATKYNMTRSGLPGNDDSGSMSSWYIFHSLGFYPNAGQNIYLISSPVFEKATIKLDVGKEFIIKAHNADRNNIYIQSARLNGKELRRCWLTHEEIIKGGILEFVMGDKASTWGQDGELPFSMSLNLK